MRLLAAASASTPAAKAPPGRRFAAGAREAD